MTAPDNFTAANLLRILVVGFLLGTLAESRAGLPPSVSSTNAPLPKRGGTLRLALPNDIS